MKVGRAEPFAAIIAVCKPAATTAFTHHFRTRVLDASAPQAIDLLIKARWIVPMTPGREVLEDHAVAVHEGRIVALCDSGQESAFIPAASVTLPNHVLIPGLVNAHGHAPMSLLRGVADDVSLKEWLEQRIWVLEKNLASREFVHEGASLAMAEMIAGGTTCFADMYFFPDEVARAALEAGMRVQLASPVLDFPTVWAGDADEYIIKATHLHDEYRNHDLIDTAFGPHAPYTVADAPLHKLAVLAEEMDMMIHMHVHETAREVEEAVAASGRRPLARLKDLGLVSPRLQCVHATWLLDEEIDLLAREGAGVIHCPESNLKLASGCCDVKRLLDASVNVALGTDGCASNNDLDMFSEMRTAALLAKTLTADAAVLPAHKVLEMATIDGARALGMEQSIGSLEAGKFADMTAVDLDRFNSLPVNNPLSHLVYATQAGQVSHVWCAGETLLANGEPCTLNRDAIRESARKWQRKIAEAGDGP